MINKLIIDGENIELNESSKMPYTHTFQQAKTHTVKFGLDKTNEICAYAFKDCANLTKIEIPETITMLKRGAFMNCTNLPEITLHEGINYIGNYCFDGCNNLSEIKFEGNESRNVPEVYCKIPRQTTIYVPDGSKYELVNFNDIDTSGDIDYFELTSWGEYVRVDDLTTIVDDDDHKYYRNKWDSIGDNNKIKENKNRRPVTKLTFDEQILSTTRGNTEELTVNIFPEDCTNKHLTWTTSAPDVINIDALSTAKDDSAFINMLKSDNTNTVTVKCQAESGISASITILIANPIVATPVISPESGEYTTAKTVSITSSTQGATIYYTTDGSIPNRNSTRYDGPFEISENTTIKAIAIKELNSGEDAAQYAMNDSAIAEAEYIINIVVEEPNE